MPRKELSSPTQIHMTEAQLQSAVIELAKHTGHTLIYHTHDSRRSQPGFPDLILIDPIRRRILARELKTDTGTLRGPQALWLAGLQAVGIDAAVWRPADLRSGMILKELRGA